MLIGLKNQIISQSRKAAKAQRRKEKQRTQWYRDCTDSPGRTTPCPKNQKRCARIRPVTVWSRKGRNIAALTAKMPATRLRFHVIAGMPAVHWRKVSSTEPPE